VVPVYVLIGRVEIHPGHEDEARQMIQDGGIVMVRQSFYGGETSG
jgi:hypothetical protein